jgi:DNA-binding GntR family transcriptional regulator
MLSENVQFAGCAMQPGIKPWKPVSMPPVNEIQNSDQSTTQQIRQILLDRILNSELLPGQRINENQVAAEFQVSRGPVREALRSLEQAYLVEMVHNRGVFVRKLDIREALHLYDVRAAFAYLAGKLLARRLSAEKVRMLYDLHEKMEEKRLEKDAHGYSELNELFHSTLIRSTGNDRLIEWSENIDRELRLILRGGVAGPSRLRESNEQHLNIIRKIDAGDAQGAALAFEEHIASGRARALDSLIAQDNSDEVDRARLALKP